MKLLIVRHGDPDYSVDSLTPGGWEEAELLSRRLCKLDVKAFYVSPLGRARDTARVTLDKLGRTAQVLPWLREPEPPAEMADRLDCFWDWLPGEWTRKPAFYDRNTWWDEPIFQEAGLEQRVREIRRGLDGLLADHGYVREGELYRAERANEDTLVLICHFGIQCVLLSHLLGVSPMVLWHGTCAAPTSVTTLVTEERRKGIASFRMTGFGDISHLYEVGRGAGFAARFCETFDNTEQRHD